MDVLGDLGFQIDKQAIRQINQTNPQVKQIVTKSTKGESQNSVESEKNMEGQRSDRRTVLYSVIVMTAVTLALRLHTIDEPNMVCWDETHFGKFASYYINRTFYFDVHPPLGKLMLAGMGYVSGFEGDHPFTQPGESYGNHSVHGMRVGCALMGVAVIPMGYITVYEKTGSTPAALLAAAFLAFDTGLSVLTRFILLDPIMLCFIFAAVMSDAKFRNLSGVFGVEWWAWLTFTGLMLGCTISTKYVGLFLFCYVGISTVQQLWEILGQTDLVTTIKHTAARALCLLVVPSLVYLASFYIHFAVLKHTGPGRHFIHPHFEAQFVGSKYTDVTVQKYLTYQSNISLRGRTIGCGFLHSHPINYPQGVGSRQQMVTMYHYEDGNNLFKVKSWEEDLPLSADTLVRHGDLVRLEHVKTGRNLHSHKIPALVKSNHYQVTGYGWKGRGDANDVWRIEIQGGKVGDKVETFKSFIRLRHYYLGCLLSCSGSPLPLWGRGQGEIICAKWEISQDPEAPLGCSDWSVYYNQTANNNNIKSNDNNNNGINNKDKNSNKIDNNNDEILNDTNSTMASSKLNHGVAEMIRAEDISPSFWDKVIESHKVMFGVNNKLGKKHDGTVSGERTDPYKWPFNIVAQTYSGWHVQDKTMIWMLGNPLIWGFNLLVIFSLPLLVPLIAIKYTNRLSDEGGWLTDCHLAGFSWMMFGWVLHYFPFFLMGRSLYQHHYYPSSVFISMGSAILIDRGLLGLSPLLRQAVVGTLVAVCATTYALFSPLVYGMVGDMAKFPNSTYHYLHWTDYWDF